MGSFAHGEPSEAEADVSPPITPPDTGRTATPGTAACVAASGSAQPSIERLHWALRNLTLSSGLNSAVAVAAGVPLAELEGKRDSAAPSTAATVTDKGKGRSNTSKATRPPPPPPVVSKKASEGSEEDAKLPHGCGRVAPAGVGLTLWSKTGRAYG